MMVAILDTMLSNDTVLALAVLCRQAGFTSEDDDEEEGGIKTSRTQTGSFLKDPVHEPTSVANDSPPTASELIASALYSDAILSQHLVCQKRRQKGHGVWSPRVVEAVCLHKVHLRSDLLCHMADSWSSCRRLAVAQSKPLKIEKHLFQLQVALCCSVVHLTKV